MVFEYIRTHGHVIKTTRIKVGCESLYCKKAARMRSCAIFFRHEQLWTAVVCFEKGTRLLQATGMTKLYKYKMQTKFRLKVDNELVIPPAKSVPEFRQGHSESSQNYSEIAHGWPSKISFRLIQSVVHLTWMHLRECSVGFIACLNITSQTQAFQILSKKDMFTSDPEQSRY